MYAVIASGGKQERVEVGNVVDLELLGAPDGGSVRLAPVLIVDGTTVIAEPKALAAARVEGRVVGASAGPKIKGFTYKPKSRSRRRFGHRQHYTRVEITAIETKTEKTRARVEKA
ncbi:MAG TPA: 50S ribosomal protein L21 [Acidimicrobiales bacterium]|nr:50S ribosomal protein L21 [Acidimicrobiales bacterium]